jgi:peptidylprolyl isomerase
MKIANNSRYVLLPAVLACSALLLTGCTTDGGISNASQSSTSKGTKVSSDNQSAGSVDTLGVKVSGSTSAAPTMVVPAGVTTSKLIIDDIATGNGAAVQSTSTLTVHYTLYAGSTGKLVETSWTSGQPATFALAQVIPGWQKGMLGMKTGGRRLLIIPADLGYGANGAGPIGKNETLVFVVDLVKVA